MTRITLALILALLSACGGNSEPDEEPAEREPVARDAGLLPVPAREKAL